MTRRFQTTVGRNGRIEVQPPELAEGHAVDVVVHATPAQPKLSFLEVPKRYPARPISRTAGEVDAYIDAERDSWER